MKKLVILILLLPCFCFGQQQGNIWYFGDQAGIDFNSGSPITLTNGQTYLQNGHAEGTAVICDSSGALLFYSNGERVWNTNGAVMPNGDSIYGSYSSTQSSLIIPVPGKDQLFYLFTTDDFNHNLEFGFRYSMIDMCLDMGLGDVISTEKNVLLLDTVSEKLTAVRHANGTDYWVIVHTYFSDAFYSYQVSSGGISSPIITHIGSVHTSTSPSPVAAIGYMKASPDGSKLALASSNGGNLRELFDFNTTTGILSNYIDLHTSADLTHDAYGVSFSPDNSKLYMTWNIKTIQYDLSAGGGNPDSIRNSKTIINPTSNSNNYGIQLGPDGKIYVTQYGSPFLNVINNPNSAGIGCNYLDTAISLSGNNCNYGLPNFIDSYDYSNTTYDCLTEIDEQTETFQANVYPNPFTSELTVDCMNFEHVNFSLFDGFSKNILEVMIDGKQVIDITSLADGIYFYQLRSENGTIRIGKIVKQ
jgi:hypothetical protein